MSQEVATFCQSTLCICCKGMLAESDLREPVNGIAFPDNSEEVLKHGWPARVPFLHRKVKLKQNILENTHQGIDGKKKLALPSCCK